jgi:hypothetical protein
MLESFARDMSVWNDLCSGHVRSTYKYVIDVREEEGTPCRSEDVCHN